MATPTKYGELSIYGDNASYTLTLSGMNTSKRYHVFIADLNASGKANEYYCRRSSIGSSSSWTYSGSSSATYAKYQRLVQVYQTDSATPFNVGSKYTADEITSGLSGTGWTNIASEYIPAASSSATLTIDFQLPVVASITFSNGKTAVNSSAYHTGSITYSNAITISSITLHSAWSDWSGTISWSNGSSTYEIATVTNGSISYSSQTRIDYTGDRTITLIITSAKYLVKLTPGLGISGGKYRVNSTSGTEYSFDDESITIDVGYKGYVYLTSITYADDYIPPVTATPSSGSSWEVINSSGNWVDPYISAPSQYGTRTVELTAVRNATLTIDFQLPVVASITFSNGKTAVNSSAYHTGSITYSNAITISSITLNSIWSDWSGNLSWSDGTNTYLFATVRNGNVTISSSQTAIPYNRTNKSISIIVVSASYFVEIICGDGITGGSYQINGSGNTRGFEGDVVIDVGSNTGYIDLKSIVYDGANGYSYPVVASDSGGSWTVIDNNGNWENATITGPAEYGRHIVTLTAYRYKAFYYQYRYVSGSGTIVEASNVYATRAPYQSDHIEVRFDDIPEPTATRWKKNGEYSAIAYCHINYTSRIFECTSNTMSDPAILGIICSPQPIARFTWLGSDLQDNAAFASGKYISDAITASGWNAMYAKIKELAEATGGQFDYDAVSKGDAITATEFNYMRWGIINLPWHGSLPNAVAADMPIFADYFNGSVSLKSALNASIDEFNNQ